MTYTANVTQIVKRILQFSREWCNTTLHIEPATRMLIEVGIEMTEAVYGFLVTPDKLLLTSDDTSGTIIAINHQTIRSQYIIISQVRVMSLKPQLYQ